MDDIVLEIIGQESPIIQGIAAEDLLGDELQEPDDVLQNPCASNFSEVEPTNNNTQSLVSDTRDVTNNSKGKSK